MGVHSFPGRRDAPNDTGGEPPDNDGMEARIAKLEAALPQMQVDVAVVRSESKHYATKADVSEAKNSIIMWVVSAILLAQLLPPLLKKLGL